MLPLRKVAPIPPKATNCERPRLTQTHQRTPCPADGIYHSAKGYELREDVVHDSRSGLLRSAEPGEANADDLALDDAELAALLKMVAQMCMKQG